MFEIGDPVRVFKGDLTGAYGQLISIDPDGIHGQISRPIAAGGVWSSVVELADLEAN